LISLNGVVQKPNTGTSIGSNDGFCLDGSSIHFGGNLTAAPEFIIYLEHAGIGSPSDNAVTTAKIANDAVTMAKLGSGALPTDITVASANLVDGTITTADIAADAINGTKIADDAVGAEHIEVLDAALQLADSVKIQIGTGNDLELYHNGTHNYITNAAGKVLYLYGDDFSFKNAAADETLLSFSNGYGVNLYYDNSKKLQTNSTGIQPFGNVDIQSGGHLYLEDNGKVQIGNSQDLQIYHDGSHSYLDHNNTGNLYIRTLGTDEDITIQAEKDLYLKVAAGETAIKAVDTGAVELYYDNSKKFETTSTGATITGKLLFDSANEQTIKLADNRHIHFGDGADLKIYHDGFANRIAATTAHPTLIEIPTGQKLEINHAQLEVMARFNPNTSVELFYDNSKKFETWSGGIAVHGHITVPDNGELQIGTGDDLKIYHDGNNNLILGSPTVLIKNGANSESYIRCNENGSVELYYDGSKKFETYQYGVTVTGNVQVGTHAYWGDNGEAIFGAGSDMKIFHSGSNAHITHSTSGSLFIDSVGHTNFRNAAGTETRASFNNDGAVELYYDGTKRLDTNASGITIFGGNGSGRILPGTDGEGYIGESANKWNAIYATNSTIQTSDRNEKNTIVESDLGLDFVNKLKPVSYKWNKDDGKTHYGLIAQDVEETLSTEGKTDKDFAGLDIPKEGSMGLAYTELISPLIKAVQELTTEVQTLKTKVAALEAK